MEIFDKMIDDIKKETGIQEPENGSGEEDKIPKGVTLEEVSEMIDSALNKKGYATQGDIDGLKSYISDVVGAVAKQTNGNNAGEPAGDKKEEDKKDA